MTFDYQFVICQSADRVTHLLKSLFETHVRDSRLYSVSSITVTLPASV